MFSRAVWGKMELSVTMNWEAVFSILWWNCAYYQLQFSECKERVVQWQSVK
jgi:hypothetical protein